MQHMHHDLYKLVQLVRWPFIMMTLY